MLNLRVYFHHYQHNIAKVIIPVKICGLYRNKTVLQNFCTALIKTSLNCLYFCSITPFILRKSSFVFGGFWAIKASYSLLKIPYSGILALSLIINFSLAYAVQSPLQTCSSRLIASLRCHTLILHRSSSYLLVISGFVLPQMRK